MKIGDKVRFLSETGGGKITGFKGHNIVLVEDEDGFEIPTPVNDVVVVQQDDYSTSRVVSKQGETMRQGSDQVVSHEGMSVKALLRQGMEDQSDTALDDDPSEKDITYRHPSEERKGGNLLTALIAFVPIDIHQLTNTRFEVYFVNDSNYSVHYTYLTAEGANWQLRQEAEVEPNTKAFIEEVGFDDLNCLSRACVQLQAYKRDKAFVLKPTVDTQFRIDPVKFFKLHAFQENPFFETPAMLYYIIENDVPTRPLVIDAKQLRREMYKNADSSDTKTEREDATQDRHSQLVSRYAGEQSKGNRKHSPYIRHRDIDNAVVVDLHIDQLVDTTTGMSPADILNYQMKIFRDTLALYAKQKGQKIIFIHGKGEGVLRRSIINDLTYRYKSYIYQDASFQEYGYGATQVTIK